MVPFSSKLKREKGQGLVKYAIIFALVAMVVIGVMRIFGPRTGSSTFGTVNSSLDGVAGSGSVGITGSFEADDLYWNNPANGCNTNYTYGTNAGCDDIIDRVQACLAGGTGPYCDDYFAVYPQ